MGRSCSHARKIPHVPQQEKAVERRPDACQGVPVGWRGLTRGDSEPSGAGDRIVVGGAENPVREWRPQELAVRVRLPADEVALSELAHAVDRDLSTPEHSAATERACATIGQFPDVPRGHGLGHLCRPLTALPGDHVLARIASALTTRCGDYRPWSVMPPRNLMLLSQSGRFERSPGGLVRWPAKRRARVIRCRCCRP